MKHLKKLFILVAALILSFSFVACEDLESSATGTMRLVIGTATPVEYTVNLDEVEITEGALSVLKYLKEEKGLEYIIVESEYGAYLTKVGEVDSATVTNGFIQLFTSVEKDFDVSAYMSTVEYDGITLTSSGLGISSMTIEDGCIIYIGLGTY